jgi:competence protein ComEA
VRDLDNVRGIGPALIARVAPRVTVGQVPGTPTRVTGSSAHTTSGPVFEAARQPASVLPKARESGNTKAPSAVVNINTASADELASLKYVGPALAQRIVDYRARFGPFPAVEALHKVRGIGPHIISANRALLSVR